MHGVAKLITYLSLGYVLCVVAKKQAGLLKTLGYTLGVSILILGFAYGLLLAEAKWCGMEMGKGSISTICPISKFCPMGKR